MELLLLVVIAAVAIVAVAGVLVTAAFAAGVWYGRGYWDGSECNGKMTRHWPALQRMLQHIIGQYICSITYARTAREALTALPPTRRVLYAGAPHGVLAFSAFLTFMLAPSARSPPGGTPAFGVHWLLTTIPFVRDIVLALNATDASWPSLATALQAGYDVALVPGGVREMLPVGAPGRAAPRRGFLRKAWEHDLVVVPVHFLDEERLCYVLPLTGWLAPLGRVQDFLLTWLKYPFPLLWLPIPWRFPVPGWRPLRVRVGAPLDPRACKDYEHFEREYILY